MVILIKDERKISAIQEEFNTAFPYLKLEFFTKPHKVNGASPAKEIISNKKTLNESRRIHNKGELIVTPFMTVAELEEQCQKIFGLSVQVFRKSGKVWLETTFTDSWTLEEQNGQGEALSKN